MSRGPSMTALLGLLAIAGYQNRDKITEWFGGGQGGAQPGKVPDDRPAGFDRLLPSGGGGGLGTMIHDGLSDLMDGFKKSGHGPTAESWVAQGPNKEIAGHDLEHALGADTLSSLQQQTGLSKDEILKRLAKELPGAVDRYTPDGRIPHGV